MWAWVAVAVGSILIVLGLLGAAGNLRVPGVGGRVEPRLDGLAHLLLGGCLLINGGRDAADSEGALLGAIGTVLGVAGIIVLVRARVRAARIVREGRGARTGSANPPPS